jgi:maleate isomerase
MPEESSKLLGLIWPDDGSDFRNYELLERQDDASWLRSPELKLQVAFSRAELLHSPEDLRLTGDPSRLLPPARQLAKAGCDALIWACTSASFIGGLAWAREQTEILATAVGRPVSSTTLAFMDALRYMNIDEVDLLSPYPLEVTNAFRQCLENCNVAVARGSALGAIDASASHRLELFHEIRAFVAQQSRPKPILLPDTAINTLDKLEQLEAVADQPILTANQVIIWQGLRILGCQTRGLGPGLLFAS